MLQGGYKIVLRSHMTSAPDRAVVIIAPHTSLSHALRLRSGMSTLKGS
jgi:hypothetical protein